MKHSLLFLVFLASMTALAAPDNPRTPDSPTAVSAATETVQSPSMEARAADPCDFRACDACLDVCEAAHSPASDFDGYGQCTADCASACDRETPCRDKADTPEVVTQMRHLPYGGELRHRGDGLTGELPFQTAQPKPAMTDSPTCSTKPRGTTRVAHAPKAWGSFRGAACEVDSRA